MKKRKYNVGRNMLTIIKIKIWECFYNQKIVIDRLGCLSTRPAGVLFVSMSNGVDSVSSAEKLKPSDLGDDGFS